MRLLSGRRLFVRLRRGSPSAVPEDPVAYTADQVVWLVPDTDSDATRAVFSRVLADNRRRWLLASLSGRRQHQFLGDYVERHTYMTVHNSTTRFYGAGDFHRRRRERGRCRGGRYRQRPRRAGVDLNRRAMEDVELRVLYPNLEIAFNKLEVIHQGGIITGGVFGSLILILQRELGFNYSLHPVEASGNLSAWDHAVQLLHQGHGDMFGGWLMTSSTRDALIDFSLPLLTEIAGAAIDQRQTLTLNEFQITQPLELPVWYALLATQLLAVLVLCLIARCQQHIRQASGEPPDPADPSFWALVVLGVSCQQGAVVRSDTATSYRLAITSLYLASLFIVACYSGNLLAEMTLARRVMPFDTLGDAIQQGWHFTETGLTLALRETVVEPLMGRDIDQLPMVAAGPLEGRNILMTTRSHIEAEYNCTRNERGHVCPVCLWPGSVIRLPMSMSFRPDFPYLGLFNDLLRRLAEGGVIRRQFQQWMVTQTEDVLCQLGTVDFREMENKPLTISNLKSVVMVVCFGLVVASSVLLCEWVLFLLWNFWHEGRSSCRPKPPDDRD